MLGILLVGSILGALAAVAVLAHGASVTTALLAYGAVGMFGALAVPALCLARRRLRRLVAEKTPRADTPAG